MKGVFVIVDGVSDEACSVLNGKTPLEAADTPNLDYFAGKSKMGHCYPIGEGIAPESSSAVVSLFGYDYRYAPRGPLEAVGGGIKMAKGDLALRCNFATVDDSNWNILDPRAGRTLTTKEARKLAEAINEKVKLPFKFELYPMSQHRAVLVFRGGFSDNISNANPFYGEGFSRIPSNYKMIWAKPLDDEDDSKLSADLVNQFIRKSNEILDKHPINVYRARKGLYSANFILCRDAGNSPVKLKKLPGNWMALSYMPLETGIAMAAKMDLYKFRYPKIMGIDVYDNLYSGLKKAMRKAIRMLKRNWNKEDYFYIHIKETDIPGHDNKPDDKVKMIEMLDKKLFYFLRKFIEKHDAKLLVTADHTTSCRLKAHSDKPVPVLFYSKDFEAEPGKRFSEKYGLEGRKIMAKKLLQQTLFQR